MIPAILLAAHLLAPDCQRLCLYGSTCWFDWVQYRCADSRVVYLGTWDPVPWGYVPPREQDFPAWPLSYPRAWGEYPLEKEGTDYWSIP